MNWLAHLYLSEPTAGFYVGNLLPDLVPVRALADLSGEMLRGVEQHRKIDVFTDAHPIFWRSRWRLSGEYRRFSGVLVDVLYDHFLICEWSKFSSMNLQSFIADVHNSFDELRDEIPLDAYIRLARIRENGLLCVNSEISGVLVTLERIGLGLRRPVPLENAMSVLEKNYDDLRGDFLEFFPEMVASFSHISLDL